MSIGTILLIGGAVVIMFLMHRVGHGGHAGAHGAGGNSAHAGTHGAGGDVVTERASGGGRGLAGAKDAGSDPEADGHSGHRDREGEEGPASAGQRQKKHGCC